MSTPTVLVIGPHGVADAVMLISAFSSPSL